MSAVRERAAGAVEVEREDGAAERSARRLFFALWPSRAMQAELADAARDVLAAVRGGRWIERESLHLTLVFLGSVPQSAVGTVHACARSAAEASSLEPPGIEIALDTIEYWPRAEVLCAIASRRSASAAVLARHLKEALGAAGFGPDPKPFRAHVTLVRKLRRRPAGRRRVPRPRLRPVVWTFGDFALVESRPGPQGSAYSVLESFPLCEA